jgi:hypothetical protein
MLQDSDAGILSQTTEVDAQGRIVTRNFIDSTGVTLKTYERGNFNSNNNPQTLKRKTFEASAKGLNFKEHTIQYATDGKVLSDAVVEKEWDTPSTLSITRNALVLNPLDLYNPVGSLVVYQANTAVKISGTYNESVANDISSLEIHCDKVIIPFQTRDGNGNPIPKVIEIKNT